MESKTVVRRPGFVPLLTLLFIALKLVGVIAWPWVWVLAPLWITLALSLVLAVLVAVLSKICRLV